MFSRLLVYAFVLPLVSYISYTLYTPKSQSSVVSRAAFNATRLTPSTFLIKEFDDIYSEHPHIYAKLLPTANTLLLIDTGCGGASNDPTIEVTSLREYIETVGVDKNGGKPLNEGGRMGYIVVLSHCHYDHIRSSIQRLLTRRKLTVNK
jgi:glyoxylase-like metal-dependent hydrolase (beta-lactamase superfamily II)